MIQIFDLTKDSKITMITIFKRKEVEKQDEKIEYLNLGATKIKKSRKFARTSRSSGKIQKICQNFQNRNQRLRTHWMGSAVE